MYKVCLFIPIIIFILGGQLFAQSNDCVSLEYIWSPPAELPIDSTENTQDITLQEQVLRTGFSLPVFRSEAWIGVISPSYKMSAFDVLYNDIGDNFIVHTIQSTVRVIYRSKGSWSAIGTLIPSLSLSSIINDSETAIGSGLNGSLSWIHSKGDRKIFLGAIYTDQGSEPLLRPLLGYKNQWGGTSFSNLFPSSSALHYNWSNGSRLGLQVESLGNRYNLESENHNTLFISTNKMYIGLDGLFPVHNLLYINLRAGVSASPRPTIIQLNDSALVDSTMRPVPFVSIAMKLRSHDDI